MKGCIVAVFEDDQQVCQAYRQTLSHLGALVVVVPEEQGPMQETLSTLEHIDLIISDYRLKDCTGDELIRQLRESFNEDVPAMIITADTSPAHIGYFMGLGIPVLHKPASFRQVIETAEVLLQNRRQTDAD